MIISMISAMSKGRVIGSNGSMPWHMPADLAHFVSCTMGCPVIMGRKTYESIGKPLPWRKNIVLTRSSDFSVAGCQVVTSLDDALANVDSASEVFIIGGQQLYEQALPLTHRLYLTHIDAVFEGDTFFPDYSHIDWELISSEAHAADEKNSWPYRFETLERVTSATV